MPPRFSTAGRLRATIRLHASASRVGFTRRLHATVPSLVWLRVTQLQGAAWLACLAWIPGWPSFPQSPGSRPGASMSQGSGLPVPSSRPVPNRSPQRELGDCDVAHQLETAGLMRCRLSGKAWAEWHAGWRLFPQSPGSRPGAFMWQRVRGGVARANLAGLASEREAGLPPCSAWRVRHRSPQRELGDCDVAHQLKTARLNRCRLFGAA